MEATGVPQVRRRRFALDARLLIGLGLVAASVAGVVVLVGAADARVTVYAAASELAPGDRVDADDLVERRVSLDGAEELYLTSGAIPADGFVVAQPVATGQLVPRTAAASTDGLRATSLVLRLASPASGVVGPGALVDVWGVPADGDDGPGVPVVLAAQATVVRVLASEGALAAPSTAGSVEVLVPRSRVARLLQAVARGDAIAVVPTGLPLAAG